ncbi:MAG TPA: hypothetical protein VHW26_12120 [Solirubrobacteraceae bacterium]|jgi:hypothetical protein|nr:hypothetical protein [Solirubrobacteraceae bacterium]
MSRPGPTDRLFVPGGLILVAAVAVLAVAGDPADRPARAVLRSGPSVRASPPSGLAGAADEVGSTGPPAAASLPSAVARAPAAAPAGPIQVNPEALDPSLRREHDRLLEDRPVFQHLPYRDRRIGVDFDRVAAGGRLELLVTYVGSRAAAVRDLGRLLARYADPGTAYVERYERVF